MPPIPVQLNNPSVIAAAGYWLELIRQRTLAEIERKLQRIREQQRVN